MGFLPLTFEGPPCPQGSGVGLGPHWNILFPQYPSFLVNIYWDCKGKQLSAGIPFSLFCHDANHSSSSTRWQLRSVKLLLTSMSLMSLFRPMDHYNDIGHVNTNVTLQLNV